MSAVTRTLGIRHIPLARVSPVVGSWVLAISGAAIQTGIVTHISAEDQSVTVRSTCATHQHVGDAEFYTVTPTRTTEPVSFIHRVAEFLRARDALLRAPAIRDVVDLVDGRLVEEGDIGGLSIMFTLS